MPDKAQFHGVAQGEPEDILDNPFLNREYRDRIVEARRSANVEGPDFPHEIVTEPEECMGGLSEGWTLVRRDAYGYSQRYFLHTKA